VMLAVFVACLPIFFSGYCIHRWEGLLFFAYYVAYTLYLVMFATGLGAIDLLRDAMLWFAFPLTAVTLLVIFLRAWRHQR
jgi:cation:H+ antiporter